MLVITITPTATPKLRASPKRRKPVAVSSVAVGPTMISGPSHAAVGKPSWRMAGISRMVASASKKSVPTMPSTAIVRAILSPMTTGSPCSLPGKPDVNPDRIATIRLSGVAADIVSIKLELTDGDLYTLWAPRWRDAGDEWEAFLGKDEDLYGFASVPDLVAFVRTDTDNDLVDHPAWKTLTGLSAHELDPPPESRYDLIGVPDLVAENPTDDSVRAVGDALAIAASIGSVCELAAVAKFFNGNPNLGSISSGLEYFTGRAGLKRWHEIGAVIDRGWDNVIDAIDGIITTPDVDRKLADQAEAELLAARESEADEALQDEDEGKQEPDETPDDLEQSQEEEKEDQADEHDEHDEVVAAHNHSVVLGSDEDFWIKVGIDPVRMMTSAGTFYTLRCYLDDEPIFLGRNGRVSVFGSERSLARYLADEHDHDLSDLATYDDIRTAATDGSLRVDVTPDNVYVFSGLGDDIADGPDAVDREQLELAVELLRDVGHYSEDDMVEELLDTDKALGRLVAHVLDPDSVGKPGPPYATAVEQWERLETFLESRLRPE
jgi:hypothetical protein